MQQVRRASRSPSPQGTPGQNGTPGASFIPCGAWISGNVPYKKNSAVDFAENAFVALRDTSAPPFAIAQYNNGNYVRTPQGYLLAGTPSTNTLHPDWQRLTNIEPPTLYWLDSSCSSIAYTSTGSMSPSAFTVSCKKNRNGVVGKCAELWLVARKYDGSCALMPVRCSRLPSLFRRLPAAHSLQSVLIGHPRKLMPGQTIMWQK